MESDKTIVVKKWTDFLYEEGSKESKLESLKKNQKLLFSNPGKLRIVYFFK